ncbi:uncharacterized protein LOC144114819 isoform X2 [Amblyomma americanum]
MPTPTSAGPADGSEDLLVPVAKFTRPEGIVAQVGRESSAISAMDADGAVLEDSVEEHVDGVPQSPAGVSSGPSPSYFQAAHAQTTFRSKWRHLAPAPPPEVRVPAVRKYLRSFFMEAGRLGKCASKKQIEGSAIPE